MSTAIRLSAAITSLTLGVLFVAQWLDLIPDGRAELATARKAICETLAIHTSLAAQRDDEFAIRSLVSAVKSRHPEIAYAAVRTEDGRLVTQTGRSRRPPGIATAGGPVRVPIALVDRLWGYVEVEFEPLGSAGIVGFRASEIRLTLFMASAAFLAYWCYYSFVLWRAGQQRAGPVPERVRAALDSFSEGILVLDNHDRIAFANRAFATLIHQPAAELQGQNASDLKWSAPAGAADGDAKLPWSRSLAEGVQQKNTLVELTNSAGKTRVLSVNAAPIRDDSGAILGAFTTLDDQTPIQRKNSLLRRLTKNLKASRDTIRTQNQELQTLATHDPLTNCLNRRAFVAELETHSTAASRYGQALSCILVDIDRFKSINDRYGHSMGDEVLVRVASALNKNTRSSDFVCRYGGEEFCILLTHTDQAAARQVAEKLRQSIAALEFPQLTVTASFGVSSYGIEVEKPQTLLDQADAALYLAKESGRNRVMVWTDVIGATERPCDGGQQQAASKPTLDPTEPARSAESVQVGDYPDFAVLSEQNGTVPLESKSSLSP